MNHSSERIQPARISLDLDDGALTGWRWANPQKPPLLFLHATGFCASTYFQLLGGIGEAFDIFALDLRGHGRSSLPAAPNELRSWRPYVDDVRAFLDLQNRAGWTLSGHSLGAATALMAARGRKDIAALRLIEPVAPPVWITILAKTPVWPLLSRRIPLVQMAARRRSEWPDRQSALHSYARKGLFKSWAPGVLDDYLKDGLKNGAADPAAPVTLACDPRWEAATFAAQGNDFWSAAVSAPGPVKVYVAGHSSSTVSFAGRRRFERLGASVLVKSGVTHLAPMEFPADLAAFIAS